MLDVRGLRLGHEVDAEEKLRQSVTGRQIERRDMGGSKKKTRKVYHKRAPHTVPGVASLSREKGGGVERGRILGRKE